MHVLRTHPILARLILAWFVSALGVAMASPIVHAQAMEFVCSDGGTMKLVMVDADGDAAPVAQHTLDCPLCLPAAPPSPFKAHRVPQPPPAANAQHPFVSAHIAACAGAPLPPRGPPALS